MALNELFMICLLIAPSPQPSQGSKLSSISRCSALGTHSAAAAPRPTMQINKFPQSSHVCWAAGRGGAGRGSSAY